ncbi:replication initiator protein A [Deinococcus aquatilis]|uniref:replication initiator protein A n=1 Tax=Deinococcus aquatilis TaxID=519440 RepID=UPI0003649EC5|nr:replication initiator protein A [Deinococcus aquatilis]
MVKEGAVVTRIQYERNLIQLGLILAVQNVDASRTSFSRQVVSNDIFGITTSITCTANNGFTVPHGIDNDIAAAFISLFIEQGMPENGAILTTGYRLLTMVGLSDGGQNYKILTESLDRMRNNSYEVKQGWLNASKSQRSRGIRYQFNLISDVRTVGEVDEFGNIALGAESYIRIQLPQTLIDNIRSGYTRAFDMDLYQQIDTVVARSLYRILEEVRDPDESAAPLPWVKLPVLSWGEFLGYRNSDASDIRRYLKRAHQELLDHKFLQAVEYSGRGKNCEVKYIFNPDQEKSPPADLVALLTQRGFGLERARALAAEFGRSHVEDAVKRFDHALARGTKVRGQAALLTTILRTPENYPLPEASPVINGRVLPSSKVLPAAPPKDLVEPPTDSDGMVRSILASLVNREKISAAEEAVVMAMHAQGRVTPMEVTGLVAHPQPAEVINRWVVRSTA